MATMRILEIQMREVEGAPLRSAEWSRRSPAAGATDRPAPASEPLAPCSNLRYESESAFIMHSTQCTPSLLIDGNTSIECNEME